MLYGQKPATIKEFIFTMDSSTIIAASTLMLIIFGCIIFNCRGEIGSIYRHYTNRANSSCPTITAQSYIKGLSTALDAFEVDSGNFPTTQEGLQVLLTSPTLNMNSRWRGPYVSRIENDPWGNPYLYVCPASNSKHQPYELLSAGPDGDYFTHDDITNLGDE